MRWFKGHRMHFVAQKKLPTDRKFLTHTIRNVHQFRFELNFVALLSRRSIFEREVKSRPKFTRTNRMFAIVWQKWSYSNWRILVQSLGRSIRHALKLSQRYALHKLINRMVVTIGRDKCRAILGKKALNWATRLNNNMLAIDGWNIWYRATM